LFANNRCITVKPRLESRTNTDNTRFAADVDRTF